LIQITVNGCTSDSHIYVKKTSLVIFRGINVSGAFQNITSFKTEYVQLHACSRKKWNLLESKDQFLSVIWANTHSFNSLNKIFFFKG
jgi:hypothetical protein